MQNILVFSSSAGKIVNGNSAGGSEVRSILLFKNISSDFLVFDLVKFSNYGKISIISANNSRFRLWLLLIKNVFSHNLVVSFALAKITFFIYLISKLFGKKTIYFVSHDGDLNYNSNLSLYYRFIPRLTFPFVDIFIAQTEFQANIIRKRYPKKKVFVLPNPVEVSKNINYKDNRFVLWVGRNDRIKGLDILKEAIKSLSDIPFKIIGITKEDLNLNLPNAEILGRIDFLKMQYYYNSASLLISTSYTEGFPNVFLQSLANKTPIVSYKVNPDDFLNISTGGLCANGNFKLFLKEISGLYFNKELLKSAGSSGYKYVKNNNDSEIICQKLNKILLKIDN